MIVTKSMLTAIKPLTDLKLTTETPAPAEVPRETPAFSALGRLLESSTRSLVCSLDNLLKCQPDLYEVRTQMGARQIEQHGQVVARCLQALTPEQRQNLFERSLQNMSVPVEIPSDFNAGVKSSNDFFEKLLELIALIKNGYLAGYEHIIAAYGDFFTDFTEQITAKLQEWISGANDGKDVKLDAQKMRLALDSLLQKYSHPNPASVLFPKPGQGGASKEEAEKWQKALGLPGSCLKRNADGTWCVVMDIGPLQAMRASIPQSGGVVTWDTAKYSAWRTGFDAQAEQMKNMLQSLTQKYSNANSYHDNFNKTLSSHLNQFADMLKAMLNF